MVARERYSPPRAWRAGAAGAAACSKDANPEYSGFITAAIVTESAVDVALLARARPGWRWRLSLAGGLEAAQSAAAAAPRAHWPRLQLTRSFARSFCSGPLATAGFLAFSASRSLVNAVTTFLAPSSFFTSTGSVVRSATCSRSSPRMKHYYC